MSIEAWRPRRIVVGVDGSVSSIEALRWAGRVCSSTGAELVAVTCWTYPTNYGGGGYALAAYPPEWDPAADATQALTTAVKEAFGDDPPPGLRTQVTEGHPAHVLIELSNDADMLVVGTRGHGGFAGLLLGSVSAHCTEHANCPVTVTRAPSPHEPPNGGQTDPAGQP